MDANLQTAALDPELSKAITSALAILIPALVSWIVSKLTTKREVDKSTDAIKKDAASQKKDTDAAFLKLRVHEQELGIQTKVEGGVVSVTNYPAAAPGPTRSGAPKPIREEGGGESNGAA